MTDISPPIFIIILNLNELFPSFFLTWYIALIDFYMLSYPYIPEINPTWDMNVVSPTLSLKISDCTIFTLLLVMVQDDKMSV